MSKKGRTGRLTQIVTETEEKEFSGSPIEATKEGHKEYDGPICGVPTRKGLKRLQ